VATFLGHLTEIGTSPLAFAGYVLALAAWVARGWAVNRPEQQAKEIISTFKKDKERSEALGTLLGESPPPDSREKQLSIGYISKAGRGLMFTLYSLMSVLSSLCWR